MYDYMKSPQRHFETKPEYIQDLKNEQRNSWVAIIKDKKI